MVYLFPSSSIWSIHRCNYITTLILKAKEGVKLNNSASLSKILLSGVHQGSILGLIPFRFAKPENFAGDNKIYADSKEIQMLKEILERESEIAIDWFKENEMIVNPSKFQVMITNRSKKLGALYSFNINNQTIKSTGSVILI